MKWYTLLFTLALAIVLSTRSAIAVDQAQHPAYILPTHGTLTSGYGMRWGRMHRGLDLAAPVGTPILAAAEGIVTFAGWNSGGYGNLIEIQHTNGTLTRYAHASRILVGRGDCVVQGQPIGAVGATGYATGTHLHFELHLPGRGAVNPIAYLPSSAAKSGG